MRLLKQGLFMGLALCASTGALADPVTVKLDTSMGDIIVELDADKAPVSVANFLSYVEQDFYDGTVFHRVIEDFMIQGGGFTRDYSKKDTGKPIENEADNGLSNRRGTIAMARTRDPHSATAQFFINTVDNSNLDHTSKTQSGWGYAVFGRVVEGMDVVDAIAATPTGMGRLDGHPARNVPQLPVVIESVTREDLEAGTTPEADPG